MHSIARRTRSGFAPFWLAWSRNQTTVDPIIRQALTEDWPLSRLDRRFGPSCAPASTN